MAGKNILVMHGGGPTAVINASLYGIVAEGKLHGEIAHIYGAHGGPSGLVNGTLIDLGAMPDSELVRLRDAPGSAIGTGRDALAGHYPAMVELLIKNGIDIVMPTGGNGTMNTCALLQEAIDEAGADIQVRTYTACPSTSWWLRSWGGPPVGLRQQARSPMLAVRAAPTSSTCRSARLTRRRSSRTASA